MWRPFPYPPGCGFNSVFSALCVALSVARSSILTSIALSCTAKFPAISSEIVNCVLSCNKRPISTNQCQFGQYASEIKKNEAKYTQNKRQLRQKHTKQNKKTTKSYEWRHFNDSIIYYIMEIITPLTIISMQFNRIGIENTVEMNRPLLSKYCSRENDLQFFAANSFIVSEKNTNNTVWLLLLFGKRGRTHSFIHFQFID